MLPIADLAGSGESTVIDDPSSALIFHNRNKWRTESKYNVTKEVSSDRSIVCRVSMKIHRS